MHLVRDAEVRRRLRHHDELHFVAVLLVQLREVVDRRRNSKRGQRRERLVDLGLVRIGERGLRDNLVSTTHEHAERAHLAQDIIEKPWILGDMQPIDSVVARHECLVRIQYRNATIGMGSLPMD